MIAIVGKPQQGKTTLLKWLMLLSKAKQVFVLDYHGDFTRIAELRPCVFLYYDWRNVELFKDRVLKAADRAKPSLVVLDEIHMYTKTHRENVLSICELYRFAGHHDISLLCATHRIYDLQPDIRSMIVEFICFKMTELRDLEYISKKWGDKAAQVVNGLEKTEFIRLPV